MNLSILTPVHIGAGSEKYWHNNLDYYCQSGRTFVLNQRKIATALSSRELSDWSAKIASGESSSFLELFFTKRNPIDFSDFSFLISPKPVDDIRTFIRNGNGLAYLPGSSLKGAIRSVVFNSLLKTNKIKERKIIGKETRYERLIKPTEYENAVFGNISNNLLHLLQISDAHFGTTVLKHTKTFNLVNSNEVWEEGWKHSKYSDREFNDQGFVFTYECLDYGEQTNLVCTFDKDYLEYLKMKPEFSDQLIPGKKDPLENIFGLINLFTKTYIDREINFYTEFENKQDDGDSQFIIDCLNWLKEQIDDKNESCILRVGQGSGFHSITGDWRFNDHIQCVANPDQLNTRWNYQSREHEGTRYKSRKVAFSKEQDQYNFDLMGFMKISRS